MLMNLHKVLTYVAGIDKAKSEQIQFASFSIYLLDF